MNNPEPVMTDDQIYDFWLYRDCLPAIAAGDMREQFISAARALLAAAPPLPAPPGSAAEGERERLEEAKRLAQRWADTSYREGVADEKNSVTTSVRLNAAGKALRDKLHVVLASISEPQAEPSADRVRLVEAAQAYIAEDDAVESNVGKLLRMGRELADALAASEPKPQEGK